MPPGDMVDEKFDTTQITIAGIGIFQFICLSIKYQENVIILLNIYVPYGTEQIRKLSYTEAIICGDFNCPSIRWEYDDEIPGILPANFVNGNLEEEFVAANALLGLSQILAQPENRNHLDLVFALNFDMVYCSSPLNEEMFDYPSRFHDPIIINLFIEQEDELESYHSHGRTNLKETKAALIVTPFEQIEESDIDSKNI